MSPGPVLALDVDGVLLDPTRDGAGPWTLDLHRRFGIGEAALTHFFGTAWGEVIVGRRDVESALAEALLQMPCEAAVEDVLSCWFEADFCVRTDVVAAAVGWADRGARVVLATNQERRRAAFLRERLGALLPIDDVLFSGDLGAEKKDPRFFELADERLGRAGLDRVVFVDDALVNVETARRHGWTGVHFTPGVAWRAEVDAALRLG